MTEELAETIAVISRTISISVQLVLGCWLVLAVTVVAEGWWTLPWIIAPFLLGTLMISVVEWFLNGGRYAHDVARWMVCREWR